MILVYCNHITPRHQYIFGFILGEILGMEFKLTCDSVEFLHHEDIKFSYCDDALGDEIHFQPYPLLSETGIREQQIRMSQWNGLPVFFQTGISSVWPFDPFALSFYLVSRYEEYLPFIPDEHSRFSHEQSLAFRQGFLSIPLVDIMAMKIKEVLSENHSKARFHTRRFHFVPSFDIDIAYAHLGKGFPRTVLAWLKLLLHAEFKQISERCATLTGKIQDPYDNFKLHQDLADKYKHTLKYFVLMGDFGTHDRNLSYKNKKFRALIRRLSSYAEIGIHPSYRSHLNPELIRKEKSRLESITGKSVPISRFHYLRLSFPESYRMLHDIGIRDDYSMGYSAVNGFRAGTCTPFYFYDLEREQVTKLKIHPFIFMDSAMIDHLKYTPGQAVEEIVKLTDEVRSTGGVAVGIWHNYSLSGKDQYQGWRDVLISALSHYKSHSE